MFREMRRKKQQISREECVRLLNTEKRGVLAVTGDDGYPYAIPLDFYFEEGENTIYFHCAQEGHKIDAIRRCDKACFTVWDRGVQRDGDWAFYVTSVVAMGRAELVTETSRVYEKIKKLGVKYYPSVDEVDEEIQKAIHRVQMVAVHIEHMTGKLVHEK